VRKGQPAPFSRHGPAAAFAIKPEVSFPAGNCDEDGNHIQTGIVSIDGEGNIAESIGTSFATPLAASLLANLVRELSIEGEEAPMSLAKALLFHSAFLRDGPPDVQGIRYYGIGSPMDLQDILSCRQSAATIILQVPLTTRPEFQKRPFPMPSCLVDPESGLQGEVFMTLLYDPPLDAKCDVEYCRCNVNASLGTIDRADGSFSGKVKSVPAGITKEYPNEKELVEYGYKWSPLKLYYRKFIKSPWDKQWELRMELLTRSEFVLTAPLDVTLIVTVRAFKTDTRVYDEWVNQMNQLGWGPVDLRIASRGRFQP
jgi:serine protease AprX